MTGLNSKENSEVNFSAEHFNNGFWRTADGAFCLICEKKVKLADYEQAAEYFKTDVEDICELAESRRLHRIHNKSGATMICEESLFTLLRMRPTQRLKPEFLPFNPADFVTGEDI